MTPTAPYFAATTQAEIDAAEAAILSGSTGVLTNAGTISAVPVDSVARWYGSTARIPGGLCCPRLFGDPKTDFAHVVLARAVAHPNGGSTRIIPVLPIGERPPVWADGVAGESSANLLYRQIWRASSVVQYLVDEQARAGLIDEHVAMITSQLAALHAGWASHRWPASRSWTAWQPGESLPPQATAPGPQGKPFDAASLWGLRVFDDGTGLVAFARAIVRFRGRDGKVLGVVPCDGELVAAPTPRIALVKAFAPTGRMMDIPGYEDRPDEHPRLFALDLRKGRWIERPSEPAPVWFEEAMERSMLHTSDGCRLQLDVGDYPVVNETSSDHRFIWVEDKHGDGGIFRLRDGALIRPLPQAPDEWTDVPHLDTRGRTILRHRYRPPVGHVATALARAPTGRWLTLRDGVVAEDGNAVLTLGGVSKLAALGNDGHLWIADANEVRCIELARGTAHVRHRWPFPPLRRAAGAPARSRTLARERQALRV